MEIMIRIITLLIPILMMKLSPYFKQLLHKDFMQLIYQNMSS